MNLEKVINEIIYNLKPVYNELGLDRNEIDIELIDIDECSDDDSMLAWCNSSLKCNRSCTFEEIQNYKKEHNSSIKFNIEYERCIYISEKVLCDIVDTIAAGLKLRNTELFDDITIAVLEATIVHELRHLYQFKSLKSVPLQYVYLINNPGKNTWSAIFDYEINYLFERDAINYAYYLKDVTLLRDKILRGYLGEIIYNMDLLESLDDRDSIIEDTENIIGLLKDHIVNSNKKIVPPHIKEKEEDDIFSKLKKALSVCTEDNLGANMFYGALKKFGFLR